LGTMSAVDWRKYGGDLVDYLSLEGDALGRITSKAEMRSVATWRAGCP